MKLIDMQCTKCGAVLQVNSELSKCMCQFCGNEMLIDQEVQKHELSNGFDFGYQQELGRQRAIKEMEEQKAKEEARKKQEEIIQKQNELRRQAELQRKQQEFDEMKRQQQEDWNKRSKKYEAAYAVSLLIGLGILLPFSWFAYKALFIFSIIGLALSIFSKINESKFKHNPRNLLGILILLSIECSVLLCLVFFMPSLPS